MEFGAYIALLYMLIELGFPVSDDVVDWDLYIYQELLLDIIVLLLLSTKSCAACMRVKGPRKGKRKAKMKWYIPIEKES